ncbi:MAG: energy transducer TonB [Sphingobacterium sp.]|nr:energy transducer TonB [Sphingobacterium sp.]
MNKVKQILSLTCLLLLTLTGYSQIDIKSTTESVTKALKLPTRKEVGKKQLSGKYSFVVERDGSLSRIAVKDSMGYGIDEQIIQQLSTPRKWSVAVINGEPQRVAYLLPIRIVLRKK